MTSIIETEAERLYPPLTYDGQHGTLRPAFTTDDLQEAYMRGATRAWTRGEVDAAAIRLWDYVADRVGDTDWDELDEEGRDGTRGMVQGLLDAAAKVADGGPDD